MFNGPAFAKKLFQKLRLPGPGNHRGHSPNSYQFEDELCGIPIHFYVVLKSYEDFLKNLEAFSIF